MKRAVAIAGLGVAARTIHLPAYAGMQDVRVVGGFDPAAREGDFPFPLFRSLQAMLEQARPDILAVASPPAFHFEQAKQGLLAGCHVLCEKPFTTTLEEADELVKLSKSSGRWVVVNQEFRFMETNRAVKDRVGCADFGELLFLSAHQTFPMSESSEVGWRGQGMQRTCKEFGIHVLDLCRFLFNEEPRTIYARMPRGKHAGGPDHLDLIELRFSGDRAAHIILDRLSRGPHRYLDMRIDGSKGTIETSLGGRLAFHAGLHGGTRKPFLNFDISKGGRARLYHGERFKKIASEPSGIFAHATGKLFRAFTDALDSNTVPPCHAEDARRSLALVLAAYESDATGAAIELHHEQDSKATHTT
jgi:D-apiose dehydrogenase